MSGDGPKFRIPQQLVMPWHPKHSISSTMAADLLGTSHDTILRLIEEGTLRAYRLRKKGGSPWRIYYQSVIDFVEKLHAENGLEKRFTRE